MLEQTLKDERNETLSMLERLSQERNIEKLEKITRTMLRENINDPAALYYMAKSYIYQNKEEIAATLLQKVAAFKPNSPHIYELLASAFDGMYMYEEAIACYEKAIELEEQKPKESRKPDEMRAMSALYGSIASSYVGITKPYTAIEYCNKGLEYEPKSKICRANKGIANMAIGNWAEGWQGYDLLLGEPGTKRKIIKYGGADSMERWDGSDIDCLVTYAEQGIGDSIMFASCLEDAQKHAKKIVIDCDKKLEGLFKRSFPNCDVYGTRHDPAPEWTSKYQVDASIAMGSLPGLFRLSKESFPRKPYLKADPERRIMYRALMNSWGKRPKIGISWTGGNIYGGFRRLELDRLKQLIESFPNVDWVSLQYKKTPTYGLPIHVVSAAESQDYEDTAALVEELDLIISVPQAVVHLAGALGKECWCLVPDQVRWIYGIEGERHSWYESVRLYRNWDSEIEQVIRDLSLRYPT